MLTERLAEELITSGVTDIIVSIDGITQKVYEQYRVGGNLQKALNGLKYLVRYRDKYSANVNIMPQFIVFKHNQHEIDKFTDYMNKLGLKAFFKPPYFRHENSNFELADDAQYHRPQFDTISELKNAMSECINPRDVFTVQINGDVILCCHDYNKSTFYGNLFEQSVEEIWNSPKYRLDRWKIISKRAIDYCINNCMTYIPSKKLKKELNNIKIEKWKKKNNRSKVKVNLCSGPVFLENWINIDISANSDIVIDLEKDLLPFKDNSVDQLVCISAINYFTLERGFQIIKDVYRVLKDDGITRFATQDLQILAQKYLERDRDFFFQKLPNGEDRFPGVTFADKFSQWFYGFETGGKSCKYVYDFETLSYLFRKAGFEVVEQKKYLESEIEDIDLIDNRPEQMFFLEARKKNFQTKSEINNITRQWQKILQELEQKPNDKRLVLHAVSIMKKEKRFEDIVKLLQNYLQDKSDEEIEKELLKAVKILEKQKQNETVISEAEINELNRLFVERDDIFHLNYAMQWLEKAFNANNRKGVSAAYDLLHKKWLVSYPETTGYIIPTFIEYYKLSNETKYLNFAELMGEWEIDLFWEKGGIGEPEGVYGLSPRVFNTAQVILGFLSLFNETSEKKFLDSAIKAANWIVELQNENGSWSINTYAGPKTYHSRVAWVLGELFLLTGNKKYKNSMCKFLDWLLVNSTTNGWFYNTSLSEPNEPWTHLYGYTIFGLLEIINLDFCEEQKEMIDKLLEKIASNIYELIFYPNKKYLGLPGVFTPKFSKEINWSCLTGNVQIEYFLRKFGMLHKKQKYIIAADKLLSETKKTQYIDNDLPSDILGGIGGSFPINGGYSPFTIPNWAVKFFADALIQKINGSSSLKFLG
jgi:predicted SAM-dependent methyltransferase